MKQTDTQYPALMGQRRRVDAADLEHGGGSFFGMINWHDYFLYEEESGRLYWKPRDNRPSWNAKWAGKPAGSLEAHGYLRVKVHDRSYQVHRIIYEMLYGPIDSSKEVDHVDLDRTNNRRQNLRACTGSQNMFNIRKHRDNKSGFKGVCLHRRTGRWQAYAMVKGVQYNLGIHDTPELAHQAYCRFTSTHHGEFSRQ